MGSGETTPGMLAAHRRILSAVPTPPTCVLLDSPFAFQENAEELVERIGGYFEESVGVTVSRVALAAGSDALAQERAIAAIGAADWAFAGPGSPSYARRCWAGTGIPAALAGVVAPGRSGALVFASAAAVTLGTWSLPVYEIYKVGADPHWEPGVGIVEAVLGWRCAVVPHYDNREGGTHDTRFCWVGGRRLARIEPELGEGFILGVDEHTALVIDLDERTAEVWGRGGVTLRVAGAEDVIPSGARVGLDEMLARVGALGARGSTTEATSSSVAAPATPATTAAASLADLAGLVLTALPQAAPEARAALVALADRAEAVHAQGSRDLAEPLVAALVAERALRRAASDWAGSDRIRDALAAVGVEVRDSREGSAWRWA